MLHTLVDHYRQYKNLSFFYSHTLIKLIAVSLFDIFSSIYIYQTLLKSGMDIRNALPLTVVFFAYSGFCQALSLMVSIRLIHKGLNYLLFWGTIFLIFYYLSLELLAVTDSFFLVAPIFYGLYCGFYWIAYHVYFTQLSNDKQQGEEVAFSNVLAIIAATVGPILGGILIGKTGFSYVFIFMIILIFLSSFPFLFIRKLGKLGIDNNVFSIMDATLFFKQKFVFPLFCFGAVGAVLSVIWPLFIFPILKYYETIGIMASLGNLIGFFSVLIIGILLDRISKRKLLSLISPADSIVWFFDTFVKSPSSVFVMTIYQSITTTSQFVICDAVVYEQARHNNIVKTIYERELCLSMSKFLFLLFAATLFWIGLPLQYIFILTAIIASCTRFYPLERYN